MHLPRLLIIVSLTLTLSSATSPPHRRLPTPKQYVEIKRPLPFTSLTPSCTLPILSHDFGNTIGLPPTYTHYNPPINCTWSRAAINLSAAANGTQNNRIAAFWLGGVEILRTSTPEPSTGDSFWIIEKDVTKYSSLLRQPNLTLAVTLPNTVNGIFTGFYQLNLTFLYYSNDTSTNAVSLPLPLLPKTDESTMEKSEEIIRILDENYSPNAYDSPADLIIPISAIAGEGFWFIIENGADVKQKELQIPLNTYRAVIELYISFHANDEFWYSNPPDSYIEQNNLTTGRGNGAYREVWVKIDNSTVGSVIPFPVIFSGGINPLYWNPVVSIGAFDLPSYDIELTPFLGMILDGKVHFFGLGVTDALSFWLVDANLHLWLDDNVVAVKAGTVKSTAPSVSIKRKSKFNKLDGKFKIKVKRKSEFSGWVSSSLGNFTTSVSEKWKFKNEINYKKKGTYKDVEQKVTVKTEVEVESCAGSDVYSTTVRRKYPLEIKTSNVTGSEVGEYSILSDLETSMEEKRSSESFTSSLVNTQKANGTMHVENRVVLSGAANTSQSYSVSDEFGCYSRQVSAAGGYISKDTRSVLCASSL
ncbi:peptide-N4-(N-acetyl-beta-glucosaminyl)asparagine amidase A-like [Primulina huaijiensis]|uniref:peptide-N4-(N-acetyl-beta- glucosaminyl)asparagine amidase A-like n=1 Tax=Primulina huaijiensis TaxID=1492673 RepID=UPI003CC72D7C